MPSGTASLETLFRTLFQAHPWHGISPWAHGDSVHAFIEIVPTDAVKYELDKTTGHLSVDRPNRLSSLCPTLYGFVPQTYCAERVAKRCQEHVIGTTDAIVGDGDPLDVCVLAEKPFAHGNVLVRARPIGGLRMIDRGQADDKIIAVLEEDVAFGHLRRLDDCPRAVLTRLEHYFLSYKREPGSDAQLVRIAEVYDVAEAREVVRASIDDYRATFGAPETRLEELRAALGRGPDPRGG